MSVRVRWHGAKLHIYRVRDSLLIEVVSGILLISGWVRWGEGEIVPGRQHQDQKLKVERKKTSCSRF